MKGVVIALMTSFGLTFSSNAGFFIKAADLYLKDCLDSSYKYALLSGAKILL